MATKPVIAGTDGSQESMRAVEWAAREAVLYAAPLRIVAIPVMPPRMTPNPATPDTVAGLIEHSDEPGAGRGGPAGRRAGTGSGHRDPAARPDRPAEALVESRPGRLDAGAGLPRGRRIQRDDPRLGEPVRRRRTRRCPVVVAREETMAAHREIVVGVRDPAQSAAALGFAFEEAALRQARLLVVHAWSRSGSAGTGRAHRTENSRLESALATWREKFPDVEARWEVMHAHPGRVLAGSSARADLVVLGRHAPEGRMAPGVGSVTHAVLSHAHGPVVSVPGTECHRAPPTVAPWSG